MAPPGLEPRCPTITAGALTTELQTNAGFSDVCTVTGGSYSVLQELLYKQWKDGNFNVKETSQGAAPVSNQIYQYWPWEELDRASRCTITSLSNISKSTLPNETGQHPRCPPPRPNGFTTQLDEDLKLLVWNVELHSFPTDVKPQERQPRGRPSCLGGRDNPSSLSEDIHSEFSVLLTK